MNLKRCGKLNPYLSENNEARLSCINKKVQLQKQKDYTKGISIIILNLDKPELISPLVAELIKTKKTLAGNGLNIEIIIGDTGSSDLNVLELYNEVEEQVVVERNMKYHFSKNNNELFKKYSNLSYTLFLNNDIIFNSGATNILEKIVQRMNENPKTGIIGTNLFYEDMSIQHLGIEFFYSGELRGLPYHPKHRENMCNIKDIKGLIWNVPAVTGAFLCIRSDIFEKLNGFDEDYKAECQDVDLCLATTRSGYLVELVLNNDIIHLENATREKGSEDWSDRQKFVRQWNSYIEAVL